MSGGAHTAFLFGLVAVATLRGSDAVPVQAAPESASLSAAKQQLDELKSAGVAAGVGNGVSLTPELPLTQLTPGSDHIAPAAKRKTDTLRQRRSENWLVDAVMRPDGRDRGNSAKRGDLSSSRPDDRLIGNGTTSIDGTEESLLDEGSLEAGDTLEQNFVALEQAASRDARASAARADKPERSADFNPLTKYLDDWLSPQDLSLLKDTGDAAGAMSALPGAVAATSPVDLGGPEPARGIDVFAPNRPAGLAGDDNPFLQFLKTPDAPALPPAAPVDATPSLAPPMLPPSVSEVPARSTIPDFAKPDFDDRNWKPLKRF